MCLRADPQPGVQVKQQHATLQPARIRRRKFSAPMVRHFCKQRLPMALHWHAGFGSAHALDGQPTSTCPQQRHVKSTSVLPHTHYIYLLSLYLPLYLIICLSLSLSLLYCMYVCTHLCMHTCVCIYIYTCVRMYICIFICKVLTNNEQHTAVHSYKAHSRAAAAWHSHHLVSWMSFLLTTSGSTNHIPGRITAPDVVRRAVPPVQPGQQLQLHDATAKSRLSPSSAIF